MKRLFLMWIICVCQPVFALRADINGDGRVDLADLAILAGEWMQEDEDCMTNKYLTFDGTTGLVTVPNNAALNFGTGDFSICFWIKKEDKYSSSHVFMKSKDNLGDLPKIWVEFMYDSEVWFGALDAEPVTLIVKTDTSQNNRWAHYAWSISRTGTSYIYINGAVAGSFDATGLGSLDCNGDLFIGNDNIERWLKGSLDDLRFYKKALSAAEIAAIYNGGKGTKYTGAAAEGGAAAAAWNMDEGAGTTIVDAVGSLEGTFSESGVSWAAGGVPFAGKPYSHARRRLLK